MCVLNGRNTTAEFGEADCTDLTQAVDDARIGNQLKTYVKNERNKFLESSDTAFDEWEFASVSHKRIMYTQWCAEAWEKLTMEKSDNINQTFIDKGMTLAADGSEDHLLKLRGLEDMKFPTERPPPPPPRLTKKERREAALAQAIEENTSFSSQVMEAEKVRIMEKKRLADEKATRKEVAAQKKLAGMAKQAAKDAAAALRDAQAARLLVAAVPCDAHQEQEKTQPSAQGPKSTPRAKFSSEQVKKLEEAFHVSSCLDAARRANLAATLNVTEKQCTNWFNNQRAKMRKNVQ
ncbi:hypothetical protein CYMTET_33671 [Cymbomonas tetramitiformis]|uniref:Homeobox domain-containing protein n=1 Tax=Cymbomonas tetramitiformis TaxID=36881 RepID=A0AAE0FD71_9CHLO|nr:hypothetical protein CYMTET_33671 [Cymbomonas tetramitiformis]